MNKNYWIFSVTPPNWKVVKAKNIWSLKSDNKRYCERIRKGDLLIFYVIKSRPPSFMGVFEVVGDWEESWEQIWEDEKKAGRIIYPYRVELRPVQLGKASYPNLISKLSFVKNKQAASTYLRGAPANYGQPISEADYNLIFEELRKNPIIEKVEPQKPPEIKIRPPEVESIPSHNEIRDIICEIGKFEGKICEKEYIIDSLRLDVAWKRIAAGIPSHAFEVQLGGNFFEALTKLKHAWDKWNSKPILVTTERYAEEAKQLLSGSFHEMKDVARIIHWKKIVELHRLLKDVAKIKCEVGL